MLLPLILFYNDKQQISRAPLVLYLGGKLWHSTQPVGPKSAHCYAKQSWWSNETTCLVSRIDGSKSSKADRL